MPSKLVRERERKPRGQRGNTFRRRDQKAGNLSGVRTRCVHRAAGQTDGWEGDEFRKTTGNTLSNLKELGFDPV